MTPGRRKRSPALGGLRMRRGPNSLYRKLASLRFVATRDRRALWDFATDRSIPLSRRERAMLVRRYIGITNAVRGYHTLAEMLEVAAAILRCDRPGGPIVVEAGAGYGGSTAKLSLAVARAGGVLHVFDSFRGLPDNDEMHTNLDGRAIRFRRGAFAGTLARVQRTVREHGSIAHCRFHKGWFEDTLPKFAETVDVALLDVDLVASTRSCLLHLWPLIGPGGVIFSQDGHLLATHELLADPEFWSTEFGCIAPEMVGLGTAKLISIRRPWPVENSA